MLDTCIRLRPEWFTATENMTVGVQYVNTEKTAVRGRQKSVVKRSKILKAATKLFVEHGVSNTSMEQIAALAEVSKQTVYSHFCSKNGLFIAAIEHRCEEHALAEALVDDDRPLEEALTRLAEHFVELLLSPDAVKLHRICIAEANQYPDVSALYYEVGPKPLLVLLRDYLSREHRKGRLFIDNAEFAAEQFLSMVRGHAHIRAMLNLPQNEPDSNKMGYVDSSVAMFIRAYGPLP